MSWQYDVHICNNSSTEPGAHDHGCRGWRRIESFTTERWREAFLLADGQPHAMVIRIFTGDMLWAAGEIAEVFEHITGGGVCDGCRTGRGEMRHTATGARFLCRSCINGHKAGQLTMFGSCGQYRRVIDDAMVVPL